MKRIRPRKTFWGTLALLTLLIALWTAAVGGVAAQDAPPPYAGSWGELGVDPGDFAYPYDVATDADGNVYVVSWNQVQKFTAAGVFIAPLGWCGQRRGNFRRSVRALALDSQGNIYVADSGNYRIQKFDADGEFSTQMGQRGRRGRSVRLSPTGITVDSQDNVYVVDQSNNRIQKFNSDGEFLLKWGEGAYGVDGKFWGPHRIAVNIISTSQTATASEKFDGEGNSLAAWNSLGSADGQFSEP
ncbi:MAG: SBBP repeat-containing protein [Caldilineaceae bacterium]